jgi:ASC-1-like (ASCH) protein
MTEIKKKVQQDYFEAVSEGRKRFEVRLADFECKPGDTLVLQEQKQGTRELTGKELSCEVLFKFNTKDMEKFHTKEELEKHGLFVLAIRKKIDHSTDK